MCEAARQEFVSIFLRMKAGEQNLFHSLVELCSMWTKMYPSGSFFSCSDVTPAEFDLRPGKRPVVEDSGQRLLQHRPTLCTCFQRVAVGDATQMVALGRSILISTL